LKKRLAVLAAAVSAVALFGGMAMAGADFGQFVQDQLRSQSGRLYGVTGPLAQSSPSSLSAAEAQADPRKLATLAKSLDARVVTQGIAPANLDMSALWPDSQHPEWLVTCNEGGTSQPGLVRINLATGAVATILTGTTSCDPARRTPWGTILFGEEAGGGPSGGRLYELIDPLNTTDVTLDRTTGTFSGGTGASNFAVRSALGRLSFEGQAIYPNGVVYYSDELAPINGVAGGSFYKFVPSTLRDPGLGPIAKLSDSPPGGRQGPRPARRRQRPQRPGQPVRPGELGRGPGGGRPGPASPGGPARPDRLLPPRGHRDRRRSPGRVRGALLRGQHR